MNVSVAMAAYNGAAYLAEQLESIARQDVPPDELVLVDDGSRDATIEIARDFAARAPFPVRIEVNPANLGTRGNFARAISLCRGRWIFLADQDDRWREDKIRRTLAALGSRPGMALSNAALVDEHGEPLGRTLWDAVGFSRGEQREASKGLWPVLLRKNVVTGATLAFHSDYRALVLPIPDDWMHDAWIGLLIACVAPATAIDEPLIAYRQHPRQQIGARSVGALERWRSGEQRAAEDYHRVARQFLAARQRLAGSPCEDGILAALEEKAAHAQVRYRIHAGDRPRLPAVFTELVRGRYRRYSLGWRSLARDVLGRNDQ